MTMLPLSWSGRERNWGLKIVHERRQWKTYSQNSEGTDETSRENFNSKMFLYKNMFLIAVWTIRGGRQGRRKSSFRGDGRCRSSSVRRSQRSSNEVRRDLSVRRLDFNNFGTSLLSLLWLSLMLLWSAVIYCVVRANRIHRSDNITSTSHSDFSAMSSPFFHHSPTII